MTTPTHYPNTLQDCQALTLNTIACLIDSYLPPEIAGVRSNWLAWVDTHADQVAAMESWQQAWYLFWDNWDIAKELECLAM